MNRIDFHTMSLIAQQIRDALGDEDDSITFWDTLDGETDARDILEYLLEQTREAEAFADAIKARADAMHARSKRIAARGTAHRVAMMAVLKAAGERRAELTEATIGTSKGRDRVVVYNDAEIPTQLCKVVKSPDAAAIKKQLLAGVDVPGARLETGPDSLTVRAR